MHITLFPWPLGPPWSNKTEQALFCGRDSREERLHLVTLSKKNPELLDAGITGWFFFREREKDLGKANLVGFFDFFKVREHSEHYNHPKPAVSHLKTDFTCVSSEKIKKC